MTTVKRHTVERTDLKPAEWTVLKALCRPRVLQRSADVLTTPELARELHSSTDHIDRTLTGLFKHFEVTAPTGQQAPPPDRRRGQLGPRVTRQLPRLIRRRLSRSRFAALWLALGLLGGLAGLGVRVVDDAVERTTTDLRFSLRGEREPSPRVVIVALDDASIGRLPAYPIPRELQAQVIRRLHDAGAAVIALDFALERRRSAAGDRAVLAALEAAPSVLSVATVTRDGRTLPLAGRTPFSETTVTPGATALAVDPDQAVRRFPPDYRGVRSFALAAADAYARGPLERRPAR